MAPLKFGTQRKERLDQWGLSTGNNDYYSWKTEGLIFRLTTSKEDYRCLGDVLGATETTPPKLEDYCCVHQDYLRSAETEQLWNTIKTEFEEQNHVMSILSIVRPKDDSSGVIAGNFRAINSHGKASVHQDADYFGGFEFELDQQYMLRADENIVKMSYASGTELETEIDVFEVRNLTEIVRFGDTEELKDTEARIWNIPKKEGLFPIGMVMTEGKEESFGLVIKPKNEYVLSIPWSYNYIFGKEGYTPDGAHTIVHFWTANCPPKFVGLGAAVTKSAEHPPATGTHYCIHESFAVRALKGHLRKKIFENFYEIQSVDYAKLLGMSGQGEGTMAVKGVFPGDWEDQNRKPIGPLYLLDERRCSYHAEKPIEQIIVTDVKYELDKVQTEMKDPAILNTVSVINKSGTLQKVTQEIAYSKKTMETFSWKHSLTAKLTGSIGMKPVAGLMKNHGLKKKNSFGMNSFQVQEEESVTESLFSPITLLDFGGWGAEKIANRAQKFTPKDADGNLPVTVKLENYAALTRWWKDTETTVTTETDVATADLVLGPKTKVQVSVVSNRYTVDCPFTMTMKKIYFDGTTSIETTEGTFNGVNMNEFTVQYSPAVPLTEVEVETPLKEVTEQAEVKKVKKRKRGEREGLKFWSSLDNAKADIAQFSVYGGCLDGCSGSSQYKGENMFNAELSYWQSEATLNEINADPDKYSRGFSVFFNNIVELESFVIQIDPNLQKWYRDISLSADDHVVSKTPKIGFSGRLGTLHYLDLIDYKIGKFKTKNLPIEGHTFNLDWSKMKDSTNRFPAKVGLIKINYYDTEMLIDGDSNAVCTYPTHSFRVPKSDWHPNRDLRWGDWRFGSATYTPIPTYDVGPFKLNLIHFTHTRSYVEGYINFDDREAKIEISQLKPTKAYIIKIYQYCSHAPDCEDNKSLLNLPNGDSIKPPNRGKNWIPSYEGTHKSTEDGTMTFSVQKHQNRNVGFTGIEIQQSCFQKDGSDQIEIPMFIKKPVKIGWTMRYPSSYFGDVKVTTSHTLPNNGRALFDGLMQWITAQSAWIKIDLGKKILFREIGIFEYTKNYPRPENSLCMLCDGERIGLTILNYFVSAKIDRIHRDV